MISIVQQIKNSLQNKRFVIFTILFPVVFYIFFIKQLNYANTEDSGMIALFSAMFGIAGSGLNTFSQKVSKDKGYFRIMDRVSPYSYMRYMFDSVVAQTILNIMILFFITLAGVLLGNLKVTVSYLYIASLLLYFGFYYIVIGFLLGTIFNDETLAQTLKTLGDETRYKVLIELIQPHAKNKDIAKKLGLTRASISFHTQKLLNSGLLELVVDDDSVKYTVNKELIQKVKGELQTELTRLVHLPLEQLLEDRYQRFRKY